MSSSSQSGKPITPNSTPSPPDREFVEVQNISLLLILHNIVILLPFSYTLTIMLKYVLQRLGLGELVHSPTGVLLSRLWFATVNILLVNVWAAKLGREENMRRAMEREIRLLDMEIENLERLLRDVRAVTAATDDLLHQEDDLDTDDGDLEVEVDDIQDAEDVEDSEDEDRVIYDSDEDSDKSVVSVGGGKQYGFTLQETDID